MYQLKNSARDTLPRTFTSTAWAIIKLAAVPLVTAAVAFALYVRVDSKSSKITIGSKPAITVQAAGRGEPFFKLQDGREMAVEYRGDSSLVQALRSGAAQPRALASADFDRNGTPDVAAGYSLNGVGIVTLQRGNPDAFAPADDSVFVRLQQGYNPEPLLPAATVYSVPVPADFLFVGQFDQTANKDILVGARGGDLYVLSGDGNGGFSAPQAVNLPGVLTALAAGEFRAGDVFTDIAVGVSGPGGDSLLIFDDAAQGFSSPVVQQPLSAPATAIEFGALDDDPFQDVAVATGTEVLVVHGWGRKEQVVQQSRLERISIGVSLQGLALGEFEWDRQGRSEIAALSDDGTIHLVQQNDADTRPFSAAEAAQRTRAKLANFKVNKRDLDVESAPSWQPGKADSWKEVSSLRTSSTGTGSSARPLVKTNLTFREVDDLISMGQSQPRLEIVHPTAPSEKDLPQVAGNANESNLSSTTLDTEGTPIAVLTLPKKLNGETDVLMLNSTNTGLIIVPSAPNTTITVDRTDDPSGAALTAASACTAAGNDCSLRGAFQFANNAANNNTTISLPANTYILSINGSGVAGCDGNTVGDLGANQTVSLVGAGAATTIIRQTATGPANDGDRVMCMNEPFTLNLIYNFSGFTMVGGRDGTAAGTGLAIGGGGVIGGEKGNVLTMTNVVLANNQVTVLGSANIGGGGIQWTGGDMNATNCTFGGSAAPGAYTDRTSTNTANLQGGSGGGVMYTPSAPQHSAATGILTVSGSTFSRNTTGSTCCGGAGVDLVNFAFAAPGSFAAAGSATIGTSTFSNNQSLGGFGGAIDIESLPTTVATTSFTNNSAASLGGAIYLGGGSLTLNGTTPSITFTGNTATNGGSGIGVNVGIDQDVMTNVRTINPTGGVQLQGTNTNLTGHDIYLATNGAWTNVAGSSMTIGNLIQDSGNNACGGCANFLFAAFKVNNTTSTLTGNWTFNGGTFVGDTGTVNLAGNLVFNADSNGHGAFTAGSSTVNLNGSGSQSISNNASFTFFNLTDSNVSQPLTLNNSFAVNGSLNVNGANAILSPVAAAVISGTGTLTGTGTARASRIVATPDFLSQYTITNKTLTNLTIDYTGAGNQTVNNTPAYSNLTLSGSGIKTLQGNTVITRNLTINSGSTFASGNFNFALGGNWTNGGAFTPGTGTVTFQGSTGTQSLTGNTAFFNLALNNAGATTNFGATTTTIGNDLVASAGTMDGGTSTIIFTGVTDNAGSISGAAAKNFHNLTINSPVVISNSTGGNISILNDYTNGGTFTQAAGLSTTFATGPDGVHAMSGAGASTFGVFAINTANTINAGSHNFNVIGASFTSAGTAIFNGNTNTVSFNGGVAQTITGDGAKNFSGLLVNNANGVQVANGAGAVDALVSGLLTLTTNLTVASGAILQQSGTSAGAADVIGTVRRTDLGVTERPFGNLNNTITINSGTGPTQMDFNLVKAAPGTFPSAVKVVPRDLTLTPTGGGVFSGTLKLRYIDPTELTPTSISEPRLILWKNVGGTTWTPQGGTVNAGSDFVSLSNVSSFSEWAIAEGSDLTLTKANNVANAAVTGQAWNWTLTATNTGAPATFTAGQTILSDNLPNSNVIYGTPTVQNATNITGSANISCSITSNDLTCTANGGSVTFDSNIGASKFDVVFSATPQAVGSYQNPRTGGGVVQVDPNNVIVESNEGNNSPTNNTVTVTKANTTTTITSDNPDSSVVGQPVTVQWSVTVNAPGTLGAALTGNVTVSDGTNQCVAAVSAGQCDVTFTSAGAKSLTATYAGDTNYNGSASTPATPHTVNAANTTTTITEDNPDPSNPGQSVTVKWTVTVDSPGLGTPTGNVNVTVSGGAETCSAALAAGQCSLVLNATGTRTITATYVGDANFNSSNDTESHDVCPSTVVTTNADSGAGSLRDVISGACDGSTVTFDLAGAGPHTITLTTGEIAVAKNLTIKNSSGEHITVSGNNASRIFNINSGNTVSITSLTLSGGNSALDGGAILNNGTLTIVNSTLSGNVSASDGGAISTTAAAPGLTLINTTISGNSAAGSGGGVIVLGGTMTSINTTITNNSADSDNNSAGTGGGVRADAGVTTLKNTIVAGNFNEDGASDVTDDISGTVDAASSFNLIGTGGAGGLTNGVNNNQVGVASADLGPLTDNGGLTQTHALFGTSPAIEAGSNANLPADTFDLDGDADTAETLPLDQRGKTTVSFPRVADSADADAIQTVDIGAFELHPSVENIPDKNTPEDTLLSFSFNIGDGTGALITSVTATSSNTTLVPNANLSVTGAGTTRTLDITPAANRNSAADGTATITVTVTATNGQTATDTFVLTVDAINDAPSFVKGADQTVNEDAGPQTVNGWATSISQGPNETGQTLTFNVSVTGTTGSLAFSSAPAIDPASGNLTYTTSADTNGTANLSVTLSDNGSNTPPNSNTSGVQTFTITVNPINDPPSFTKGADQNVADNAGPQTVVGWATNISQGPNETGQTPLTFTVTPTGTIGTLTFSTPPAIDATTGTLTYTVTNGTNGTATFDVTLTDSGSNVPPNSNTSAAQSFTITVNTINDPPVNTVPGAQSMPRNTLFTFSGANQISVADPDAILTDNVIRISLTATNGTLTLSGTAGLNFACAGCSGDGTADSSMVFEGTIPNLNTALNGMSFTPALNFTGAASVQIVSDDLGKTGSGGPQTDTDTVNITVTVPVDIYINEVLFNPPGTDAPNEYIELRGTPSSVIPAGTYLVAIEGDPAENPGDVQTIINLSNLTFGSNGFLVLLQNGNTYTTAVGATVVTSTSAGFGGLPGGIWSADAAATDIEDSSVTFMLIQTGNAPSLTSDIDSNDDGGFDGSVYPGWSVRDSISAMNASLLARAYGAFSFRNSAGTGTGQGGEVIVSFIPSYVGRVCDSTGSTAADWVASGVLGGAAPNWTLGSAAETEPASFASKLLNHLGASNFANLAPTNTVPGAQATNEDIALTFNAGNANLISISDPDAGTAAVKVTLTATNGTFSLGSTAGLSFTTGDGTNDTQMVFTGTIANINTALNNLTFTPPANFFSPPDATLTILTEDQGNTGCGGNKTDSDTINITVGSVNDPPSFTLSGNPPAVNEDAGAQTVNGFATSISQGGGETGQTLTFNLSPTGTTGNIAFSSGPAINTTTGALTYTTSADTNGTASFNVTLSDNGGGTNTSGVQAFTITVNAVNDAPSFQIASNPPAVNEDAGAQTVNSFATNFLPGPVTATDEAGQTLVGYTVTATGTTGNLSFSSGPSVSNAGTLTYTPTANTSGTATFNVVATDSGSGTAPNVNQSAPVAFTITVNSQNDAPVLDNTGNMSLTSITENQSNATNPGTLVSDIIASAGGDRITDVDAGALEGIAVIAVDNSNGAWQFSIDNGANWTAFGSPSSVSSRLLASNITSRIRFVPNAGFSGTVNPGINFRAWDQTTGTNGNTADTTANGGTTAFSTATETASITVNDGGTLQFSAATYNVSESAVNATITITRTGGTAGTATVQFSTTTGGTATAGSDYTAVTNQTVIFNNGETSKTVDIPISNDALDENDETVNLTISSAGGSGALGSPATAVLTINDDDATPSLSINDVSQNELNSGSSTFAFTVTLSAASGLPVTVNYATANGTATIADNDYLAVSSTLLTFNPGDTTKTVNVTVNGDIFSEGNETFFVNLSTPGNATISDSQGQGTILDDDAVGGTLVFSAANYIVAENAAAGGVQVTVNRLGNTTQAVTVDYATSDVTANERKDYTAALGTLKFAAGETAKTFTVLVNLDAFTEGSELVALTLSNPTGGANLGVPQNATVQIDNSVWTGPPANPIDDASFFVRQHYHDFLNREPDAPGLAYWTNEITSCGSDASCTEVKRINVSAAFFLSIEFQETGFTAYLANKVAFLAVPRYQRFERETQALQRGFAFGTPGSAAVLEANKVAYFNEFVAATDFDTLYGGLSNDQYVDALIANTGVTFTASERNQLVAGLNGATETRATVLRKITEKSTFKQAEFNRAFVLMEYFGYLRRNPDDPPDNNLDGFNFWFNKLNQFNGNFISAEMVKAFISSIEYRTRFAN